MNEEQMQLTADMAMEATNADSWFMDLSPFAKIHLYRKYKGKNLDGRARRYLVELNV